MLLSTSITTNLRLLFNQIRRQMSWHQRNDRKTKRKKKRQKRRLNCNLKIQWTPASFSLWLPFSIIVSPTKHKAINFLMRHKSTSNDLISRIRQHNIENRCESCQRQMRTFFILLLWFITMFSVQLWLSVKINLFNKCQAWKIGRIYER